MTADEWKAAQAQLLTPCFDAIRVNLQALGGEHFPGLEQLNQRAATLGIANRRGQPIRFVAPDDRATSASHYEMGIAQNGQVSTRANWHDFFNALQWLSFPAMKAAISEGHANLLLARGNAEARSRSVQRDVLTLLDEGGLLVATSEPDLLELIREFRWNSLFVMHRQRLPGRIAFYLAGHAMLEKMLTPFVGITAKSLLFQVTPQHFELPKAQQVACLDALAADWVARPENLTSTRNLNPLPILGVPGWDDRNTEPTFYDDANYFRSGYRKQRC